MDPMMKWIGGATAGMLLMIGVTGFAGKSLEERLVDPEQWLSPDDPLATPPEPTLALAAASAPREEPFTIKRILPIEGPIKYGEWHWDEQGAPAEGPLVITVDLEARVMSVFRGGYEIGATAVLLGTDEHPTPLGVHPILSKERHNVSEKYDNAPMPWTLRLTHDGVAIHGGSTVEPGWASHGCIGTPDEFVSRLFAIAKPGDKVIITDGKRANVGDPLI
jgi:lipoprotein-anchoring transpeptidase ErfK/SrfK